MISVTLGIRIYLPRGVGVTLVTLGTEPVGTSQPSTADLAEQPLTPDTRR